MCLPLNALLNRWTGNWNAISLVSGGFAPPTFSQIFLIIIMVRKIKREKPNKYRRQKGEKPIGKKVILCVVIPIIVTLCFITAVKFLGFAYDSRKAEAQNNNGHMQYIERGDFGNHNIYYVLKDTKPAKNIWL